MNKEILKYTTKYEDELLEDLKDPREAQSYLEAAFELYEEDGNTEAEFQIPILPLSERKDPCQIKYLNYR